MSPAAASDRKDQPMASTLNGETSRGVVDRWNAWSEDERAEWMREAQVAVRPVTVADLLTAAFPDWPPLRVVEEALAVQSGTADE